MDIEFIDAVAEFSKKVIKKDGWTGWLRRSLGMWFRKDYAFCDALKTERTILKEAGRVWCCLQHGKAKAKIPLKSVKELLCPEDRIESVRGDDEDHSDMLDTIEEAMAVFYMKHPEVSDLDAIMALERLERCLIRNDGWPEDSLEMQIDVALRVQLAFSDYSFRDVKKFLRWVLRSAEQNRDALEPRSYLEQLKEGIAEKSMERYQAHRGLATEASTDPSSGG